MTMTATSIDFFYQGEGITEIEHLEVGPDHSFSAIKAILIEKHGLSADLLIFLEDCDEPLDEIIVVSEHVGPAGIKAHLHRCREVETTITFNGEHVHHRFAPSKTVARVKHWAAVHKFGMSEEEAAEHVLQITGTHIRPSPGTHIGSLAVCPKCSLAFDLVPDQRVNGSLTEERGS
jgi:hypothetical protein